MKKTIGFWQSWSLVVGTMIGSGIFLLPSVLAPYGSLSIIGWLATAFGTFLIALTLGSLSSHIDKEGGPYAYCYQVIGPSVGFLIGWGLWISFWVSIAAASVAFSGYASSLFPLIENNIAVRTATSLALVWCLGGLFLLGMRAVGTFQLITTLAKLTPLLLIPCLGFIYGNQSFDMTLSAAPEQGFFETISKMVLITMWAFLGIELATIPASTTSNPKKTIPRAIFFGLLSVTFVYLFATVGLWFAIPIDAMASSSSPFADAAEVLIGPIGATIVAIGVMVSIVGSVNGCFVATVILPQSMADDGLFPKLFTQKNKQGVAWKSVIIAVILISILLVMNSNRRLVGIYESLIIISTLTALLPYSGCAIAELILQFRAKEAIRIMPFLRAIGAFAFSIFMIVGAGLEVIIYGVFLLLAGWVIYLVFKSKNANRTTETSAQFIE